MNKRTGFSLLTGIVGILLLAGVVWSQGGAFTLRRQTVAAGRADMISPNFQMSSIGGQVGAVGSASSNNFSMAGGFQAGPWIAASPTTTPTPPAAVSPTTTPTPTPTAAVRPVGGYGEPATALRLLTPWIVLVVVIAIGAILGVARMRA